MRPFRGGVGTVTILTILVVHVAALSIPLGGLGSFGEVVKRISIPNLFERSGNNVRDAIPPPSSDDKGKPLDAHHTDCNDQPEHTDQISSTTVGTIPLSVIPFISSTSGSVMPQVTNSAGSIDPNLVPPAVKTVCNGQQGTPHSVEQVRTRNVTITAGDCPPSQPNPARPTSVSASLSPRAGCNYPPNTCSGFPGGGNQLGYAQCGARCDSTCYWGSGGPDPNDCEQIFNYFRTRSDPIFQVGGNKFLLFTYKTCGTGIQNQVAPPAQNCNANLIYDYPDWGTVGSYLAWNCQGTQGARGGKCQNPSNNFYIQVYRNG